MALNFLKFAHWVRTTDYAPSERLLLLAVALHSDDFGETFAGYDTLHKDTGLCCKQIGRLVRRLEAKGGLIVTPRPGTTAILCCLTPDNMSEVTGDLKSPQSGHHVRSDTMSDQTPCPGSQDTMSGGVRTPCPGGQDMVSHDLRTDLPSDLPSDVRRVAPARDDHPPPQGPDRTVDGRTDGKRPRPEHPSERTYTGDLLSPEAEQIHQLLLEHQLPLNKPTGMANRIAGKLGMGGNNKLTVARVKMAIEAVAEKAADAAADGEPRTAEEVRDHLKMWLRYSERRWKELEDKQAEEREAAAAEESPPVRYFRPERTTPEEDKAQAEANAMSIKGVLAAIKGAAPKQTAGSDIES